MSTDKPEDFKKRFGKDYLDVYRRYTLAKSYAKDRFIDKYPNAVVSRFIFRPILNDDGTITRVDTLFKYPDGNVNIKSKSFDRIFLGPSWRPPRWPKMWSIGGTVRKLR